MKTTNIKRLSIVALTVLLSLSSVLMPLKAGATGGSGAGTQSTATTLAAIGAIGSATTLSDLNTAVQAFLNQYSLTYSTAAVPDTAVFSTTALSDSDFSQAQSFDIELVQEWSKYTPTWVAASHLQTIYAVTNLHVLPLSLASSKRCASYGQGSDLFMLYDVDCSGNESYMRETINHEYAHFLLEQENGGVQPVFDESAWNGDNPGGFTYGNGGASCYGVPNPCLVGEHVVTGFVTGYATASIYEDQAETYAYLFATANYQDLNTWIPADTALNAKVSLWKSYITSIDPTMDDSYFTAIQAYAAANYSSEEASISNIAPPFAGPGTEYTNPDGDGGLIWDIPSGTTSATAIGIGLFGKINVGPTQTLILDGTITGGNDSGIDVGENATLKGSGTAEQFIKIEDGGILSPGHSPGCLTTNNLIVNGTYQAEIGGTQACTGYDQMEVTGGSSGSIVAVTTPVDVTGGRLDTSIVNSFVPAVGNTFTIINNESSSPVTGTFAGLPEGATFTSQGVTYSISYKGGDGNDVVLTVTNVNGAALAAATGKAPGTPNTGLTAAASHPVATLMASIVAAATLLFIGRRLKTEREAV